MTTTSAPAIPKAPALDSPRKALRVARDIMKENCPTAWVLRKDTELCKQFPALRRLNWTLGERVRTPKDATDFMEALVLATDIAILRDLWTEMKPYADAGWRQAAFEKGDWARDFLRGDLEFRHSGDIRTAAMALKLFFSRLARYRELADHKTELEMCALRASNVLNTRPSRVKKPVSK